MRLLLSLFLLFGFKGVFAALPEASVADSVCPGQTLLTRNDTKEYPICLVNGSSLSQEFSFDHNKAKWSQALEAFIFRKKAAARSGGICATFAAELIETKDADNKAYNLCQFADGSYIDETTLWLGPGHNEELDSELQTVGITNSL